MRALPAERGLKFDREGLELSEESPAGRTAEAVSWEQVPELLAARFGLPGFELGAGDRIALAG